MSEGSRGPSSRSVLVWLLMGDKPGDNGQLEVIGDALAVTAGWRVERRRVEMRPRWVQGKPRVRASLHHIDPQRSDRLEPPWPREPLRVVLDTAARTPPGARLITSGTPARAFIAVGETAPTERVRRLMDAGVTLVRLPGRDGRIGLPEVLAELQAREVRGVLVEGGAEVHGAFLEAGLVDRVAVFVAPRLMGGREATPMAAGGGLALKHALRLGPLSVRAVGEDVLIEADVCREPA